MYLLTYLLTYLLRSVDGVIFNLSPLIACRPNRRRRQRRHRYSRWYWAILTVIGRVVSDATYRAIHKKKIPRHENGDIYW